MQCFKQTVAHAELTWPAWSHHTITVERIKRLVVTGKSRASTTLVVRVRSCWPHHRWLLGLKVSDVRLGSWHVSGRRLAEGGKARGRKGVVRRRGEGRRDVLGRGAN